MFCEVKEMNKFFTNEILSLKKNIQTYFNDVFKDLNLKSSEIKLIHILSKVQGESQAELAKRLDCDKAHIHRIVIKLMMKKIILISNEKSETCRNLKIMLTEHGKKIAEIINKKLENCQSTITKGINIEDINATKRVLQQMNSNIKKEKDNV